MGTNICIHYRLRLTFTGLFFLYILQIQGKSDRRGKSQKKDDKAACDEERAYFWFDTSNTYKKCKNSRYITYMCQGQFVFPNVFPL